MEVARVAVFYNAAATNPETRTRPRPFPSTSPTEADGDRWLWAVIVSAATTTPSLGSKTAGQKPLMTLVNFGSLFDRGRTRSLAGPVLQGEHVFAPPSARSVFGSLPASHSRPESHRMMSPSLSIPSHISRISLPPRAPGDPPAVVLP